MRGRLRITIPTYNRPEQLSTLLERLIPQLDENTSILVIDNHSQLPCINVINSLAKDNDVSKITVIRNVANLGASANVMRCIELAESDWVWIIGDDDEPVDNAIELIWKGLQSAESIMMVNFSTTLLEHAGIIRTEVTICHSLEALSNKLDSMSNLLFISATVYNRRHMITRLKLGYSQVLTHGPHVAMLLDAMQDECGVAVLHPAHLINWKNASPGQHWNMRTVYTGLPCVFDVVKNQSIRAQFADLNQAAHPINSVIDHPGSDLSLDASRYSSRNLPPRYVLNDFLVRVRAFSLSGLSCNRLALALVGHGLLILCRPILVITSSLRDIMLGRTEECKPKQFNSDINQIYTDERL